MDIWSVFVVVAVVVCYFLLFCVLLLFGFVLFCCLFVLFCMLRYTVHKLPVASICFRICSNQDSNKYDVLLVFVDLLALTILCSDQIQRLSTEMLWKLHCNLRIPAWFEGLEKDHCNSCLSYLWPLTCHLWQGKVTLVCCKRWPNSPHSFLV